MKIGVNVLGAVPGAMGGVESYFRNVFMNVAENEYGDEFTLICDERGKGFNDILKCRIGIRVIKNRRGTPDRFLRSIFRKFLNIDLLRSRIDNMSLDVIHFPFSVMSPLCLKTPTVLTFHDMQHEFYPYFFTKKELENRKRTYRASAHGATRVIAISNHVKRTLIEIYQLPPEKIDVIYPGYGIGFRIIDDEEKLDIVRKKYCLERPFMYYPAASWPHKNHKRLLEAVRLLMDDYGFGGELVLTGIAKEAHSKIYKEIASLNLGKTVRMLGFVPYEDVPFLYNLAELLVFPSLFEGFGIPLVEAMACGCPVVCSNVSSLPEVAGDAGELFDPFSVDDIARKLRGVWNDDMKKSAMKAAGIERARMFNWQQAAEQTLNVYRKAIG